MRVGKSACSGRGRGIKLSVVTSCDGGTDVLSMQIIDEMIDLDIRLDHTMDV